MSAVICTKIISMYVCIYTLHYISSTKYSFGIILNDGKYIIISSKVSDTFFIMSQKPEENFDIYGYIKADGLVMSTSFE